MRRRPSPAPDLDGFYHTFELPGRGLTRGYFDLRGVVGKLPLPSRLDGMRCLDVAACEGFWSFELARRGAREVVSLDLPDTAQQDWQGDLPSQVRQRGSGLANEHFRLVRDALGLPQVTRVDLSVYDISPSAWGALTSSLPETSSYTWPTRSVPCAPRAA
jgi:hypothetical protein